jgi:hypothetical protein
MEIHWRKITPKKNSIGTLTVYDAGQYRIFTTDTFYLGYKILTIESKDDSFLIESVSLLEEDWFPFEIYSKEEYPLYSLSPTLEFGQWSLSQVDLREGSQPSPQQENQVSPQPSPQPPPPFVKQAQPSSYRHQKQRPHRGEQKQPALRNRGRNEEEQKVSPSSNSAFREKPQSQHQSQKAPQNAQSFPNGQIAQQSQWTPLGSLLVSPSSPLAPIQKASPQRRGRASGHHSAESTHSHEQPTSRPSKLKHPHPPRVPEKKAKHSPPQPMN